MVNWASTDPFEYGMTVNIDGSNFYAVTNSDLISPVTTNMSSTSYRFDYGKNTYMICHTHPKGSLSSPSPSDAIAIGKAYKWVSTNIYCNVIFAADGTEYVVYVSDRTAFTTFCNNTANDSFFNTTGSNFQDGTSFAADYKTVYDNLMNQDYSQNDANSFALTSVLDKYNTGMKKAERDKSTQNFREQSTGKSLSNTNNYQPKRCPDTTTSTAPVEF